MKKYRKLTHAEIEYLEAQRCIADNWANIEVADDFSPANIENVSFTGKIELGLFKTTFEQDNGQTLHSGIYNAKLHNCTIGDNVYISDIHRIISNCNISDNCFIANVSTISHSAGATFGNGVMVASVNENGGRAIPIFDRLSAQLAHILVYYRHRREFVDLALAQIERYVQSLGKRTKCSIGRNTAIIDCKTITNTNIAGNARLEGVEHISNSTIGERAFVGNAVITKNFICGSDTRIDEGAIIERCFVGEGCMITKGFSATDTLMFANSEFANGESASVFAAPYTVSHHRSSLMIACGLSFANIGSGTNMSNHAYKLGAVHQTVAERGCKFGSNSYLLSPTHIGAYTMILGSHKNHPDTHEFPFSYLVEENGISTLIPAVNLFRIGTLRDVQKWQKRDRRQGNKIDTITYDLLNPLSINKIEKAIAILKQLQETKPSETGFYDYKNTKIHIHSLRKAIGYYQDAITVFIGDYIIDNEAIDTDEEIADLSEWVDVAGLIAPKREIENFIDNPPLLWETDFGIDIFGKIKENYKKYVKHYILGKYGTFDDTKTVEHLKNYIAVMELLDKRLQKEASSEFFGDSRIGFGLDYPESQAQDFAMVSGSADDNKFLQEISAIIQQKIERAKRICKKE